MATCSVEGRKEAWQTATNADSKRNTKVNEFLRLIQK